MGFFWREGLMPFSKYYLLTLIFFLLLGLTAIDSNAQVLSYTEFSGTLKESIQTGADQTELYLPLLQGKKVGLVVNPTSVIGINHLVDTLLKREINIVKVFGPEHGFRGEADAGEKVKSDFDSKSKLPTISLYGKNKKPSQEQLADLDVVVFDIQDVGCRFYTYISTLTYVMEACAEYNKELIVLDRPNPNGNFVDGPILEEKYKSFVGLHPVPIVHGCTVGEYAQMVKGERWITKAEQLRMKIIKVKGWNHTIPYTLPVKPSPNLPNMQSIWLYPSLCLFEGTLVSVGRGTDKPFQLIGYPKMPEGNFSFKPQSLPGAKSPPYKDTLCTGFLLAEFSENYIRDLRQLYLYWIVESYKLCSQKEKFFNSYFETLAGTAQLRKQIMEGKTDQEIHQSWQEGLASYKTKRKKYLLYTDFE
jgi:uncharacterized protein YbbC (DUF1343 family)